MVSTNSNKGHNKYYQNLFKEYQIIVLMKEAWELKANPAKQLQCLRK